MSKRNYTGNAEESEKAIEKYLCDLTKAQGGLPLKYFNANNTGFPDRLLLFPDCEPIWVEVKSKGKNPTPLQAHRICQLREVYRQRVYVCDSRTKATEIVMERNRPKLFVPRNSKNERKEAEG